MDSTISFSNHWWNKNYGYEFNQEYYNNNELKVKSRVEMNNILKERFPQIELSVGNPFENIVIRPFEDRFFPAMFGCKIHFAKDQSPWAEDNILSEIEIEEMPYIAIDEFKNHEFVKMIVERARSLRGKFEHISTQQNMGSVINTGIYLRGMELFVDFYERPHIIHKLYSLITKMMIVAYDYFSEVDGKKPEMGIGNCGVAMLSPEIYKKFNYHYDRKIMEKAMKEKVLFGIHQDSNVTKYINAYKSFEYLNGFDIGWDTDIKLFRSNFPTIKLNIFLYTSFLHDHTIDEIRSEVKRMKNEGGPPDKVAFVCGDIDDLVEDEKIIALYEACNDDSLYKFCS